MRSVWKPLVMLLGLICLPALAEEIPNHNIVLFELDPQATRLSSPRLVAATTDYENQPCFSPDLISLVYTRMNEKQADIWLWDAKSGESAALVETELSEYSPTFLPGQGDTLSTVRVEADGAQRLWRYSEEKGFELIFQELKPVGYHVWCGPFVGLFILGEPHTLQIAKLGEEKATAVAEKVGRCLKRVPGTDQISFTVEEGDRHRLKTYHVKSGRTTALQLLPAQSQDYLWLDGETVLGSDGQRLLKAKAGSQQWDALENSVMPGISGITRLALSPDGKQLAVVYEQK